jgi:hypothetical protein
MHSHNTESERCVCHRLCQRPGCPSIPHWQGRWHTQHAQPTVPRIPRTLEVRSLQLVQRVQRDSTEKGLTEVCLSPPDPDGRPGCNALQLRHEF